MRSALASNDTRTRLSIKIARVWKRFVPCLLASLLVESAQFHSCPLSERFSSLHRYTHRDFLRFLSYYRWFSKFCVRRYVWEGLTCRGDSVGTPGPSQKLIWTTFHSINVFFVLVCLQNPCTLDSWLLSLLCLTASFVSTVAGWVYLKQGSSHPATAFSWLANKTSNAHLVKLLVRRVVVFKEGWVMIITYPV